MKNEQERTVSMAKSWSGLKIKTKRKETALYNYSGGFLSFTYYF